MITELTPLASEDTKFQPAGSQPAYLETNLDDDLPVTYAVPVDVGHAGGEIPEVGRGSELSEAVRALENVLEIPELTFESETQPLPRTTVDVLDNLQQNLLQQYELLPDPSVLETESQCLSSETEPQTEASPPVTVATVDSADQPADVQLSVPVTETPRISDLQSPVATSDDELAKSAAYPDITKQLVEGEPYESVDTEENEQLADDASGNIVRQRKTTRHQLLPVSEITLVDGVETSRTTSDIVLSIHVDEIIDVLPPGVDSPYDEGVEAESIIEETAEELPTGGILERRVVTTIARRLRESYCDYLLQRLPE
jgi:hypothetical protein